MVSMVQELPRNQESDAQESRSLNFSPEPVRYEAPIASTNRLEEQGLRDRYRPQDTSFNYIPRPNEVFGGNDRRFENLARGSHLLTAETFRLTGNTPFENGTDNPDV